MTGRAAIPYRPGLTENGVQTAAAVLLRSWRCESTFERLVCDVESTIASSQRPALALILRSREHVLRFSSTVAFGTRARSTRQCRKATLPIGRPILLETFTRHRCAAPVARVAGLALLGASRSDDCGGGSGGCCRARENCAHQGPLVLVVFRSAAKLIFLYEMRPVSVLSEDVGELGSCASLCVGFTRQRTLT